MLVKLLTKWNYHCRILSKQRKRYSKCRYTFSCEIHKVHSYFSIRGASWTYNVRYNRWSDWRCQHFNILVRPSITHEKCCKCNSIYSPPVDRHTQIEGRIFLWEHYSDAACTIKRLQLPASWLFIQQPLDGQQTNTPTHLSAESSMSVQDGWGWEKNWNCKP